MELGNQFQQNSEFQISDLRSQISDLRSQISNLKSQISNLKSQISNLKSQISDLRSQISDLKSQISNLKSQIHNSLPNNTLHLALALRGIGLAQKYLWSPLETETSIFGVLFFEFEIREATALFFDDACIWLYLFTGLTLLLSTAVTRYGHRLPARFAPAWQQTVLTVAQRCGVWFCIAWEVVLVLAIICRDDAFRSHWTPATHALRIGVPIALLLLSPGLRAGIENSVPTILRLAIALTFIGHGFNAWLRHPQYVTFILATADNVLGINLDQSTAEMVLRWIAVLDLLVGVSAALVQPSWSISRWLLVYCAGWGLLTAASRVTAGGWIMWPETVLRASHFLGPLALYAYWSKSTTGQQCPAVWRGIE